MKKIFTLIGAALMLTACGNNIIAASSDVGSSSRAVSSEVTSVSSIAEQSSQTQEVIPESHKVDAEGIAEYFVTTSGKTLEYLDTADYTGWYLDCQVDAAFDGAITYTFKEYFPDYLFTFLDAYRAADNYYILVLVNSNISAAATLCGYQEGEQSFIEVLIYNYAENNGLFY